MTNPAGPYSRIYWRFRDEYPDIYADKIALGWWVTLLANAEGTHPSTAELPRKLNARVLDKLVDAGLITLLSGDRYRVKGLTAERERRDNEKRNGGTVRAETGVRGPDGRYVPAVETSGGPSGGSPAPIQRSSNSKDEQSRAETSKDETRREPRPSFDGPMGPELETLYEQAIGNDPIPVDVRRFQKLAAELTGDAFVNVHAGLGLKAVNEQLPHGFDRVESAWRQVSARVRAASGPGINPTMRQLVLGADDLLNAIPHADVKEQRQDEDRAAFDRRVERTRQQTEDLRRHLEEAK